MLRKDMHRRPIRRRRRRLQRWSTESFVTLHCSAEGNFGTPPELIISTDHTESVHSLGARARSRMPPRPLVRGRAGPAAQQAGPPVDPKLEVVAAWLRNEKRSGLYTKEAVQYEKVCAARASRPCERVACGLRWRHGMRSTYRPVHEPGDAMRLQAALVACDTVSQLCVRCCWSAACRVLQRFEARGYADWAQV
jgi:hypothetical protein